MKIICDKKELLAGINTAKNATAKTTTVPMMKCVLISATGNEITITGNDMEIGIKTTVIGTVLDEGEVAVDASTISGIISKMPNDDVTIETKENFSLKITAKKAKFEILRKDPADFTRLPDKEGGVAVQIPQCDLKRMISGTIFSVSPNDNNKLMTGEQVKVGCGELKVTALDGHRVAINKVQNDSAEAEAVIPGRSLMEIGKIVSDSATPVTVYFSKMNVLFELDGTTILTRTIEGQYFDIARMMTDNYTVKVTVNKQELYDCIDRASLLVDGAHQKPLIINITGNTMELSVNTEKGSMDEVIDIAKDGQDMRIGFNPKFLMDALKVIDDETVDIYMLNPKAPCYIKNEEAGYNYLVLPVNIRN